MYIYLRLPLLYQIKISMYNVIKIFSFEVVLIMSESVINAWD